MKPDAAPVVNRSKNSGIAVVDDVLDMREDNIQIQNQDKSTNNDLFLARIRKLYQQDYRTRSESFEKIANYEIQGSRNLKEPSYFSELKFYKQKVRTRVISSSSNYFDTSYVCGPRRTIFHFEVYCAIAKLLH